MRTDHRNALARIRRFDQLIAYLRDEMGWPIAKDSFEDVDDLFYDFTADELGIDPKTAAKIESIKRLRPLSPRQPWGIFFVKFEPKKLPVVALRRILSQVALKKRASANSAERTAWSVDDLLFVSNYGEGDERQITFAHFAQDEGKQDLPTLKVLGWDNLDTLLHLDAVGEKLTKDLAWPNDDGDVEAWRKTWRAAFTLRHREVITTSKELSLRLAQLARTIRDRIGAALRIETESGPLTRLMTAFQEALVHDLDAAGFADMYAQTIAYGLLSARVANPAGGTADDLPAQMPVTNPFLKELMETFLHVGGRRGKAGGPGIDFDELGVSEVVELLDDAQMEAVVRDFGDKNPLEDPVIHFYELFLKEYDAKKRMQRGVFYTPRPVVVYIVRSVDEVLRDEFGLEDGLADTSTWAEMATRHKKLAIPDGVDPGTAFVQILDPATGTGTFLVEVIDLIHRRMIEKWSSQGLRDAEISTRWNEYVPTHLLPRLHGYELLMAPYAIAHLKIGLKLYETGYRFNSDQRAGIYLTNALEPAHDFSDRLAFAIPALAHEARAVNAIKRKHRFTVVVGNPPYAGHSSNNGEWARALVEPYRRIGKHELRLAQGKWLQNDYVKFLALAEGILSTTRVGVLGFITDHSYLDGDTFPGLRHHLLGSFDGLELLDLHGSLTRRDVPPGGGSDENVFDIQQGVAITIGWATPGPHRADLARLNVADLWGGRQTKFLALLAPECRSRTLPWKCVTAVDDRNLFVGLGEQRAGPLDAEYDGFDGVESIFSENGKPAPGFLTTHDDFAIAFSSDEMRQHVKALVASKTEAEARAEFKLCSQAQWQYRPSKTFLAKSDWQEDLRSCLYRPFDLRWTVYDPHVLVHRRERVNSHLLAPGNLALLTTRMTKGDPFGHVFVSDRITEVICLSSKTSANAFVFPLFLRDESSTLPGVKNAQGRPNISPAVLTAYRAIVGEAARPKAMFHYWYAVLHSPTYRARYNARLVREFPRIPRPGNASVFLELASVGERLVDLHLLKAPAQDSRLRGSGNNVVGPGMPKFDPSRSRVSINDAQYFEGVRGDIWGYRIGSYEVCKKWLSERRGRRLSVDDCRRFSAVLHAIEETLSEQLKIERTVAAHGGWPLAFHTTVARTAAIGFRSRIVTPRPEDRYVTCVPMAPLKIAAGAFGDSRRVDTDDWEWVAIKTRHRLHPGMFVARVVGKSMEPRIPDGAFCLFTRPMLGPVNAKIALVELQNGADPESGTSYTVKKIEENGDRVRLVPLNPSFKPMEFARDAEDVRPVAELVEVLSGAQS